MQKPDFQQASEILTDSQKHSTSANRSDRTKIPTPAYTQALLLLVQKSRLLANSPPATEQEALIQAATWAEILFEIVPLDRLDDVYRRAARDHDSAFPLGHGALITAWKKIKAEDARIRQLDAMGSTLTANTAADCDLCFGSGMRLKKHPDDPRRNGFVLCRHGADIVEHDDGFSN